VKKTLFIIAMSIIIFSLVYLLLGSFGLLPDYFYNQCRNITVEEAQKRGCCEDRPEYHPVSFLFGEDNCDRYRINNAGITSESS
jgi:hypothetical protein